MQKAGHHVPSDGGNRERVTRTARQASRAAWRRPKVAIRGGMLRAATTRTSHPRSRPRIAALLAAAALFGAGCDRDVVVVDDDPLAVEAANADMHSLLVSGATARRVAAHRLTAERVERWFAAQEALEAQSANDPGLGGDGAQARGDDAIERAVAVLEERPGAEEAIREAGLSTEEFVLTGLALHQALTASAPAAPAQVRRLAARNVRFVAENAGLLARFRTQRPTYVAEAPPVDTAGWYDPFADTLVYGYDAAAPPPVDSVALDTLAPPGDTTLPPVVPPVPPPTAPVIPPSAPPVSPPPASPPPTSPPSTSPPPAAR